MGEGQVPTHLNVMFTPNYAVPIFGYTVPPLAVLVFLVNTLMIWTLRRQKMKSPTNTILICIAVSDTLAIAFPLPSYVYFYTFGYYKNFVPFNWCRAFFNTVHVMPLLFNMASMWTTVVLAFMRCYSVWSPLRARTVLTKTRTRAAIVAVYLMSTAVYFPLLFEYSFTPLSAPSMVASNISMVTCHLQKSQAHGSNTWCSIHTWIQIVMTSLLPWFLITFPDAGLLWKLKKVNGNRKHLQDGNVKENQKSNNIALKRRRMTTVFIFLVVSMIWMVEIPFGIIFTNQLAHTNGDVMRNNIGNSVVFVFLLKYTTYPVIFVIYCFMSQHFRKTFKDVIMCRTSGMSTQTSQRTQSRDVEQGSGGSGGVSMKTKTSI